MGVVVVAFCRISGFAGGCVRIGSHSDRLVGRGGVMWRGLAVLCEDWLTR